MKSGRLLIFPLMRDIEWSMNSFRHKRSSLGITSFIIVPEPRESLMGWELIRDGMHGRWYIRDIHTYINKVLVFYVLFYHAYENDRNKNKIRKLFHY